MSDGAFEYARLILAGDIPSGPYIRGACQRFLDDIEREDDPDFPYYYDADYADLGSKFFPTILRLSGGIYENEPFVLFLWQEFFVRNVYGWMKKVPVNLKSGGVKFVRRFRKVYIETGKGSGKSPLIAGVGVRGICGDDEPRAQCYVIARTADQATVTFEPAVAMVQNSPLLEERLVIRGGGNPYNISDPVSHSFLRKVAADARGRQSGPIPHLVLVDEYHEHDSAAMRDMYAAGVKNRLQPLVIMITNSGVSLQSPCGQEHLYARAVATQEIEDNEYFALVYGVEEDDDPMENERCWIKANPSLCLDPEDTETLSVPGYDYIRSQVREARGMPSKRSVVERLNFCRWVDAEAPWIDIDVWKKCEWEGRHTTPEEQIEHLAARRAAPTFVALDLSQKIDLTAGTIAFDMGTHIETETIVWTPEDTLEQRADRDSVPYRAWSESGDIIAVPGSVVDMEHIANWIIEQDALYGVNGCAYDPWRIDLLHRELDEKGLLCTRIPDGGGLYLIPHPQGFVAGSKPKDYESEEEEEGLKLWMPQSIDFTEEALLSQAVKIKINPALRMAIAGMIVVADAANNRRPTKTKSLLRIDAGVSFVMAVGAVMKARKHPNAWRAQDFGALLR